VSTFFTDLWFIPLGAFMAFAVVLVWMLKTRSGKPFKDKVILKLPLLGTIVQTALLERFCRILSTVVSAGVPLLEGIQTAAEATDNTVYRNELDLAKNKMLEGAGFAQSLTETGLFPGSARQMFKVGEETGTLDRQLAVASNYFDRELKDRVKKFAALFEPLLIIFVGVVVGFVAVALVSAMYGVIGGMKDQM
jgi:type IV pilus assembly protein PilC